MKQITRIENKHAAASSTIQSLSKKKRCIRSLLSNFEHMKQLMTAFILLLALNNTQAQNKELKIIYDYVNHAVKNTCHMELRAKDNKVLSYTIRMVKTGPRKANTYKLTTDSTLLYKDYTDKYLLYEERLGQNNLVMKEQLNLFKWTEVSEKDTILGYPCKTAMAEFRGREYKAYYSTKLNYTAAPWKVHGLPGVVLKLTSTDDVLCYTAVSIEMTDESVPIVNPFMHEESISYNAFCKQYKSNHKKVVKKRKERAARQGRVLPKFTKSPRIEVIIPENRFILNTD